MSNTLFDDDWLKLQQKYWESLAEMGRKAVGNATGTEALKTGLWSANPWESAMNQWWQALSPGASDPAKIFMDRLMDQGKAYFSTVERFTRGLPADLSDEDAAGNGWQLLNKTFEELQKAFSGGLTGSDNGLHRMFGFWEMPMDNWQRMISAVTPMMPGDILRNMPHDQAKEGMNRMLSAPGLGYTREEQAQYQDLTRSVLDFQQAMQDYVGFFGTLGTRSVERMRTEVKALATSGKSIDSARALYDNWVMCCEDVYAEEVATEDYARIYGRLVNTQMALKKRMSLMVDENLGAFNMPTRRELRTLQDRLQETRRENKQLRRDLDSLKRQIAELSGGKPTPARAAPAASKMPAPPKPRSAPAATASKKTAARKKATAKPAAPKPASR